MTTGTVIPFPRRNKRQAPRLIRMPLRFGDVDAEVQAFCEQQFWHIGPYAMAPFVLSAQDVYNSAVKIFGPHRTFHLDFLVQ